MVARATKKGGCNVPCDILISFLTRFCCVTFSAMPKNRAMIQQGVPYTVKFSAGLTSESFVAQHQTSCMQQKNWQMQRAVRNVVKCNKIKEFPTSCIHDVKAVSKPCICGNREMHNQE